MKTLALTLGLALLPPTGTPGGSAPVPSSCEDLAQTLSGAAAPSGSVCKVNLPRRGLRVMLLGAALPTGMGLTSWAAFLPVEGGQDLVMGDLLLTMEEVHPVVTGLLEQGLTVTAMHHHMLGEEPMLTYVHYLGRGPASDLARKLRAALDRAPSSLGQGPVGPAASGASAVVAGTPCARIEQVLGAKAGSADTGPGYCKITIGRPDNEVRVQGIGIPAAMGVSSWFAFRETADGQSAVVAGDMALTEGQVAAALKALAPTPVEVVVVHNHMLFDQPRIEFFHFQGRGAAEDLARALKASLDAVRAAGS